MFIFWSRSSWTLSSLFRSSRTSCLCSSISSRYALYFSCINLCLRSIDSSLVLASLISCLIATSRTSNSSRFWSIKQSSCLYFSSTTRTHWSFWSINSALNFLLSASAIRKRRNSRAMYEWQSSIYIYDRSSAWSIFWRISPDVILSAYIERRLLSIWVALCFNASNYY